MAFAGLDVGTSGCKMLVYDLDGKVLFSASGQYQELGENGYRELNPAVVMRTVKEVLREAGKNSPEQIEAMAVASLGESVICLDQDGKILANSMLTGDCRGMKETEEMIETIGAQRIFEITGLPPNELYGLPKYMWLNRHTDAVKNAAAIFYYEDFVGYMLTGKRKVSYSSAARSMAFDIQKKEWSEELLALAGMRREQMSDPVEPCTVIGTILPQAAKELNLNPNMKLVVGGHDQSCAALGSGLNGMKTGECGLGTCGFMFAMLPEAKMTPFMLRNDFPCTPYILPETYLSSIEVTTCGALKNWTRDTVLKGFKMECEAQGKDFYECIDSVVENILTDVLVLPQFGSSGNPNLSMDAWGTITGLTIHTQAAEIYRAVLEGMAFQAYLSYERMRELGTRMESIVMTGGGAASELTLQIWADIFDMPVLSLENNESGTVGCMLMAAVGVGRFSSVEEGIHRVIKIRKKFFPNPKMHLYYQKKFEKYKELYQRMCDFK